MKVEHIKHLLYNKKVLTAAGVGLIMVGLLVWLIIYFSASGKGKSSPLDAVPVDAAIILELKKPKEFWAELSVNSGVWREIQQIEPFVQINRDICFLDSLIKTNEYATAAIESNPLFVSLHPLTGDKTGFLYLTSLTEKCDVSVVDELVKKAISSKATIKSKKVNGVEVKECAFIGKKDVFSYVVMEDLFVCGFNPLLVEAAIKQKKSGASLNKDAGFAKIAGTAGKNVNANIYINYKVFPKLLSILLSSDFSKKIADLAGFAGWSAMDISVKKDVILLNGFTDGSDVAAYLNLFANQKPHEITIHEVLPSSTASFVYFGYSDFDNWYTQYKQYLSAKGMLKERSARIAKLNSTHKTDVEKNIVSWVGSEMALVVTEPVDSNVSSNMYAVIKADNIENALTLLAPQSEEKVQKIIKAKKESKKKNGKSKNKKTKESVKESKPVIKTEQSTPTEIKPNKIYEYKIQGLMPLLFGDVFEGVNGSHYAVVGDYVVFANSSASLETFLDAYAEDKTLMKSNDYIAFSKNISSESNIFLYSHLRKSLGLYLNYSNKPIFDYLGSNMMLFKNIEAFAYQLKADGKLFYTNICLKTNTLVVEESNALWTVNLDSMVYGKPQVVSDGSGKTKRVVAFDRAPAMYLIDKDGSLLWNVKLKEKPLSKVFVVDYFKDGKRQYMFNTPTYLYLIDGDGKDVEGFPVRLPDASTAPMLVVDPSNAKEYRLIVPCGKKLCNFTKSGKPNPGWSTVKTSSDIVNEISSLKFSGVDCFVFADKDGRVYVVDKKGEPKLTLKSTVKVAAHSQFYIAKTETKKKECILTTDISGSLLFIMPSGEIEKKSINPLSAAHYFICADMNKDDKKEYIFLDNGKLNFYDSKYTLLGTYTIPAEVTLPPQLFKHANGIYVGVCCAKANKIYLLKANAALYDGFPINGSTHFSLESLNSDASMNLIVGLGSTIFNYSFN